MCYTFSKLHQKYGGEEWGGQGWRGVLGEICIRVRLAYGCDGNVYRVELAGWLAGFSLANKTNEFSSVFADELGMDDDERNWRLDMV